MRPDPVVLCVMSPSANVPQPNPPVNQLAATALAVCVLLSTAAVVSFSWSVAAAKALLPCATAAAVVGALGVVLAVDRGGIAVWTFFFACGAAGCGVNAARNLLARPARWVHRFVIYAGYEATFAAMAGAGVWLGPRAAAGRLAAIVFLVVYVIGSACVFLAKTLTLNRTARTMPEYHASLVAEQNGPAGPNYW